MILRDDRNDLDEERMALMALICLSHAQSQREALRFLVQILIWEMGLFSG